VASTFALDIVTPEKTVLSETVTSVQLPAAGGSMGVLAGHAPMLAELSVGECVVKTAVGAEEHYVLAGGFAEITRERVTILADTAERDTDIDVDRAEQSLARARELLNAVDAGAGSREEATAAMQRAQARLRIARGGNG
jgi:F-type H+-transporting ATPase subunit epsilon